jgi:hypothetical protein
VAYVDSNKQILNYLKQNHKGANKAVQSRGLEFRFQMSGRKIRDIVNTLRCDGHPICSDDGGYYYAVSEEEVMGSIRQLSSRIEKIADAKNGLVDSLNLYREFRESEKLQIWFVHLKG